MANPTCLMKSSFTETRGHFPWFTFTAAALTGNFKSLVFPQKLQISK